MKKIVKNLIVILLVIVTLSFTGIVNWYSLKDGRVTINPTEDTTSLLRNPAMGWGLYDDASGKVAIAENYWAIQDEAAKNYASFNSAYLIPNLIYYAAFAENYFR